MRRFVLFSLLAIGYQFAVYSSDKYETCLLEKFKSLNIISDYDSENSCIKLNENKVFVFGNCVKLLCADGILVPIFNVSDFDGCFYVEYKELVDICKNLKYQVAKQCLYKDYHIFNIAGKQENASKSKEHFDAAKDAAIDFLEHSIAAGLTIECLPAAAICTYHAVNDLKTMADEYLKGKEQEARESQEASENFKDMTKGD